jgi:glycosyltransferase involved in cell wall biosynthesis
VRTSPVVTGIIIFFNAQEFFVEAIESVLRQTFPEWELMLVDDGSTDGSTEIALHYAKEFAGWIRYVEHPGHRNFGMSASRNLGIREAKGEFIAFLDADDVWLPRKLEEQVMILREEPRAAMCFGPTLVWHDWAGSTDTSSHDWYTSHGLWVNTLVEPPELLVQLLNDEWTVPCICSVLVRRSAIYEVGCFEEEFRGQMEDMVFHTKMFLHRPIYVSSKCWAWYRQHRSNSGKAAMSAGEWLPHQPNPARFAYLNWVKKYLKQEGCCHSELQKVLDIELRPYRELGKVKEYEG